MIYQHRGDEDYQVTTIESVKLSRQGRVAVLAFDPGPNGIMGAHTMAQLLQAVEMVIADNSVRVIVLTGAQAGIFIRHYRVGEILRTAKAMREDDSFLDAANESPVARLFKTVAEAPKPVIAAINGVCMGGGFELALCCTRRIVQSDVAQIGLPETRIGITPGGGGTQRLSRLIGEHRAMQMVLDGTVLDAAGALALGLVDDLADNALDAGLAVAQSWSQHSPALLRTILEVMRDANSRALQRGIALEARGFLDLLRDDDEALSRMKRFLESNVGLGDYREPEG